MYWSGRDRIDHRPRAGAGVTRSIAALPSSLAARALGGAALHANRTRLALSVIGVALGVALGVAVHLINGSAIEEFGSAARHLSGDADFVIRGPLGGFDEMVYPRIAALAGLEVASPALDF